MDVDNTEETRIISFCTGYGGIELGLRRIGPSFRTVCYVEIEAFACTNLVAKIEEGKLDAAPVWTDIKTFDGRPFHGKVHGIIGGYPCQPFSNAGLRKGSSDPRHLWPYILEHIGTIRPVWCFFENVSGHLTLGFDEVFKSLRGLGYAVEAGLFTASEVGAPHKRERLFILAYDGDGNSRQGCNASMEHCSGFRGRQDTKTPSIAGGCGDGELAYSRCNKQKRINRNRKSQNGAAQERRSSNRRDSQSSSGSNGKLGNTDGKHRGTHASGRDSDTETRSADKELADSNRAGCEEQCRAESVQQEQRSAECICTRWPARPRQEQYDWESPRTVKSGMGRTVDGFKSRVDELRLLCNGVVPQTAELAFRELMGKING